MGWFDNVKSYVWDDRTTPYLVPVERMTRPQADKELFLYTLFLTIVFAVGTLATLGLTQSRENPLYYAASLYAVTMVACAIYLAFARDPVAAIYCVTGPAAIFLGFVSGLLNTHLHWLETVLLGGGALLWLRYSLRVVSLVRAYDDLPPDWPDDLPPTPPNPRLGAAPPQRPVPPAQAPDTPHEPEPPPGSPR